MFFDWDRADLTDRARQIIGEAAQNARRVSSTRIEVAGHADRSGTPQYNQRLSQRRADVVAAELPTRRVWVSHLTDAELRELQASYADYEIRPRIGTDLWLGDRGALSVTATVLDVHEWASDPITLGTSVAAALLRQGARDVLGL